MARRRRPFMQQLGNFAQGASGPLAALMQHMLAQQRQQQQLMAVDARNNADNEAASARITKQGEMDTAQQAVPSILSGQIKYGDVAASVVSRL